MITLLLALAVKHLILDVWYQAVHLYRYKHIYGHADGISHAKQHAVGTALCLFWAAPYAAIILGLLDGVLHYHIDWAKSNIKKRVGNKLWLDLADQVSHGATYVAIATVVTP